jgi:hypothetical protein
MKGITTSDGKEFHLEGMEQTIIGYQAEHKDTGRILPMMPRHEIYSLFTLIKKMGEVSAIMDEQGIEFNIWEYELVPIYEDEVEGFTYVYVNNDKEIFGSGM